MIDALNKGLNQKPAMVKGVTPATPSRAFALWLALLCLYFLLLPTAAETSERDARLSARADQELSQTLSVTPAHRRDPSTPLQ